MNSRREEIIERQYYEIKQLVSRYMGLYENAPVMLRTINMEGIILNCNLAYAKSLGYSSKDEVIGHSIFEHTPDEFMADKRESFEEWRRTGTVKNKEIWLKRKDGSKFPGLISANNLYDTRGKFVGSNTVITDLSDVWETKRLKEKASDEIVKTYEMRQEFVNIAAHELRTPIQPILGYAELSEKGLLKPDDAIRGIKQSAIRLRDLANDILAVTRIETGNFKLDIQKVEGNSIINEALEYARLTIQSLEKTNRVALVSRAANDAASGALISVDRNRMLQALENIVNNAIKFTERGQITIETCLLEYKRLYEIKIEDTGPGIHPDILPRLFDKFVTKSHTGDATQRGTGLGLFITRSIIQAHGGDIFGYNNESGCGATFVIRLPTPRHQVYAALDSKTNA